MTDTRIYGAELFRTAPDRCPLRSGEVHQLTQRWQAPSRTQFVLGQAPPDWPTMRITEIDPETEIDDVAYDIRLTAEGIADGRSFIMLSHDDDMPQEGWDTLQRNIYTAAPNDAAFLKNAQLMDTPRVGVTATAADDVFTSIAHGLHSGQLVDLTFSTGFGGAVSGTRYQVLRTGTNTLHLLSGATIYPSGVASTNVITATAHGLTNGTAVAFTVLLSGAGEGLITYVVYYVIDATTNTFKLSTTVGGAAVDFTTDFKQKYVSNARPSIRRVLTLSSDGAGATLTPVMRGYERMWVTARRRSKARGCVEAEEQGLAGYWNVGLEFKGLNQGPGEMKLATRRGGGTAQALSVENFTGAIMSDPVMYGSSTEADYLTNTATILGGKVEFDMPQVGMTETVILTEAPPEWLLGSGTRWIPENAPAVSYMSLSGNADTIHYPSGWKIGNIQHENIPGQSLWLVTFTWMNQRATTPGSSS